MSRPAQDRHRIETEQFDPTVTVTGSCGGCDWRRTALDAMEGRRIRSAARQHVARKGHKVLVHVERLSGVEIRPAS